MFEKLPLNKSGRVVTGLLPSEFMPLVTMEQRLAFLENTHTHTQLHCYELAKARAHTHDRITTFQGTLRYPSAHSTDERHD